MVESWVLIRKLVRYCQAIVNHVLKESLVGTAIGVGVDKESEIDLEPGIIVSDSKRKEISGWASSQCGP